MLLGDAAGLGSAFCWAWGGVIGRLLARRLGVVATTGFRSTLAAILAFGVAFGLGRGEALLHLPLVPLAVLLGSTLVMLMGETSFLTGLKVDYASRVFAVASSGYIFISLLLSAFLTPERLHWATAIGGVLVAGGIGLLFSPGEFRSFLRGMHLGGLGYGLGAALFWAIGSLGANWAVDWVDVFLAHALRMALIGLLLVPFSVRQQGSFSRLLADRVSLGLLGAGAVAAYGSGLLFLVALRYTSLGNAVVLSSVAPIFVVPIARWVGRERVTWRLVVGVVTTVVGVWVALVPAL
ncbi:MAG: DMT family transporter [Dehalococcoidia bacterium]|nr:DMT family transporter [Dehalococcoidia bacterium]MDW8120110.1 DMT family transporter [Chloroflexota bacterium]